MRFFANILDSGLVVEHFTGDSIPTSEGNWFEHTYQHVFAGFTYDSDLKVFYPPEMFPSWTLDKSTQMWEPPIPYPEDGSSEKVYTWDEDNQEWDKIE